MKQTWRWFGPDDDITVDHMLQAGVEGVVTSLYSLAAGTVWPRSLIAARKAEIASMSDSTPSGLLWDVVESLPVSESIKTRTGDYEEHLVAYCQSLENLAAEGIKVICYNFMPVLDWTRTDIAMKLPHGGTCMNFDLTDFAMFDIHILQRELASNDYDSSVTDAALKRFQESTQTTRDALTRTVVAGLPGAVHALTLSELRDALATYKDTDRETLRQNLKAFLEAVVPTAERLGMKLCCHPDDPPWPILGLPRIVSTEDDLAWLTGAVDSVANGITLCTGSLGSRGDNDLCALARRFADRIHFVHLRNVRRATNNGPTSFFEDAHLAGSTDMVEFLHTLVTTHPDIATLPMRPDHGQEILTDIGQNSKPGYPLCGRMRGLAELRGVLLSIEYVRHLESK